VDGRNFEEEIVKRLRFCAELPVFKSDDTVDVNPLPLRVEEISTFESLRKLTQIEGVRRIIIPLSKNFGFWDIIIDTPQLIALIQFTVSLPVAHDITKSPKASRTEKSFQREYIPNCGTILFVCLGISGSLVRSVQAMMTMRPPAGGLTRPAKLKRRSSAAKSNRFSTTFAASATRLRSTAIAGSLSSLLPTAARAMMSSSS